MPMNESMQNPEMASAKYLNSASGPLNFRTKRGQWSALVAAFAGFVGVLIYSGVLWYTESQQQRQHLHAVINDDLTRISHRISQQIHHSVIALRRMSQRWEAQAGTPQRLWLEDAKRLIQDFAALSAVEWVDESYHVRWVEPMQGNENAIGLNIAFNEERKLALQGAAEQYAITITPPLDLVQGYRAIIAYVPIHVNGSFKGFMVGLYDTEIFLGQLLPTGYERDYEIHIADGDKQVYSHWQGSIQIQDPIQHSLIPLFNRQWQVALKPKPEFLSQNRWLKPQIVFGGGFLFAMIVAIAIYTAILARYRNLLLAKQTAELQSHEMELSHISHRMGLILDNAGEGILGLDASGHATFVNKGAIEILGYSETQLRSGCVCDLVSPMGAEPVSDSKLRSAIRETRAHTDDDEVFIKADGSMVAVEYSFKPIALEKDATTRAVVVFRDITERKQIEIMKNEFISTVNHELRTPLTSIQGSIGMLKHTSAGRLDEAGEKLLNISYNNCERLTHLVNDILDMEKIVAGKMTYHLEVTEMGYLIKDIIEHHQGYAEKHQVQFLLEVTSGSIYCRLDQIRFTQAMANLLSNAAKFSPKDADVTIQVDASQEGRARISVTDHGPGIPEAFQAQIFGKFAQADSSSTRAKGGTGLGLYITKAIIQAFAGTVDFATSSEGTSFFIDLPTCDPEA